MEYNKGPAEALKTMTQSGIAEDFGDAAKQLATDQQATRLCCVRLDVVVL